MAGGAWSIIVAASLTLVRKSKNDFPIFQDLGMFEPLTDEACQAAVELKAAHGSENKAARAAGLSRNAFRNRLKRAAERGLMGFDPVLPGYEIKKTATQMDAAGNVKTKMGATAQRGRRAIRHARRQILKGVSAYVDGEGSIRQQWIKTKGRTTRRPISSPS